MVSFLILLIFCLMWTVDRQLLVLVITYIWSKVDVFYSNAKFYLYFLEQMNTYFRVNSANHKIYNVIFTVSA